MLRATQHRRNAQNSPKSSRDGVRILIDLFSEYLSATTGLNYNSNAKPNRLRRRRSDEHLKTGVLRTNRKHEPAGGLGCFEGNFSRQDG